MKKIIPLFLALILAACSTKAVYGPLSIDGAAPQPVTGHSISITSWNVGYGALGAKADFISDGGGHLRALDRAAIDQATLAISSQAAQFGSDFLFFQELSKAGFLTHNVPLLQRVTAALPQYSAIYWPDLTLEFVPEPLHISHGMGVYARRNITVSRAYELPQEPDPLVFGVRRYYGAIVNEVPIRGVRQKWVLINVHMSAFDEGANVRRAQVQTVFDFAQSEYAKGNYVVIGGDWNLRLATTEFANTTAPESLTWLADFPREMLPEGWRLAVDPRIPTVRTLYQPYVAGENYTAIIDGFAYSPNVAARDVHTYDSGFIYTDHHAVTARFSTR